ncbi:hypothetical protein Tco_0553072 [Tanacetum coccineum]
MLDRTDFASWQQRIRLYCRGKENGVNILKSIDEGPFQIETIRDTIAEGSEGAQQLGPERPRVYSDLSPEDKDRMQLNSKFVNNMLPEWGRFVTAVKLNRGLRDSNYDQLYVYLKQYEAHANENKMMLERLTQPNVDPLALMYNVSHQRTSSNARNQATVQDGRVVVQNGQGRQNRGHGNNARGTGAAGYGGAQNRVRNDTGAAGYGGAQNRIGNANPGQARQIKCYNYNGIAQENGVALDEEQLLFIAADDCDAFDSDVDEAPTTQTMFMANLSSADPVYDKASWSYDSDILSEVLDHDNYQDAVCEHHEVHEMHDEVQPNYVVDSHDDYTSDSNMIPYDQYVKDNAVPVVQSNVSSVPTDAYMMILNDMHELRAKFELTEREQKIDEQLRIVITDRNIKEEKLKRELHSVKMQLNSIINHNKSMVEEVTSLKKDFKHKENKYLEEFLDMRALKEKRKVAIGYKNPFYLSKAKQIQPALYSGQETVKPNHARILVHDSEDTLEIAETTSKQMNEKNERPRDLLKMKAEALKEQTTASRPIKVLTVYPPNTPVTLVPRVLLTKSQVKINIFALIQLFSEFDKTCKKRITPTGLTEGERGFEQTKICYLTEVIPFFKTIKEHFEGIQKALINEIKEMKEVFDQMEAEVDQNAVDKNCDEIEQKNLLIENENLIAECFSKDVFYTATAFVLTVSRFSDMHDAYTVAQKCIAELEAENSNLTQKIQKDDHDDMIKYFSKLEVEHLNLQLKYQHLKERFGNKKSVTSSDALVFESVFEIGNLKEQLQGRDSQNKDLNAKVNALHDLNEHFRAENEKVKQHYKELYDSIKLTRVKTIEKTTSLLTEIENLKAQIKGKTKCVIMPSKKPKLLDPGMYVIDVEPIPSHNRNNKEVHLDYLKRLKESVTTLREIVEEARVEKPLDSLLVSACLYTKHSQELLEYVIGTCPKDVHKRDKKIANAPLNRKKRVTFVEPCETSPNNTQTHVEQRKMNKTKELMIPSTRVNGATAASGSKLMSNTKKDRTLPAKSDTKKVEDHLRNNKSSVK